MAHVLRIGDLSDSTFTTRYRLRGEPSSICLQFRDEVYGSLNLKQNSTQALPLLPPSSNLGICLSSLVTKEQSGAHRSFIDEDSFSCLQGCGSLRNDSCPETPGSSRRVYFFSLPRCTMKLFRQLFDRRAITSASPILVQRLMHSTLNSQSYLIRYAQRRPIWR
ncbi:hypothetical protein IW262DRAFT_1045761 [Armillaria fumosa]|nr:hypothetical protein IW262DRAFT_1045761 [Armillaria fumosa]